MRVSDLFGNFIAAKDLAGQEVDCTIAAVTVEEIEEGKPQKLILAFEGRRKRLVCNKTNAMRIAEALGETDIEATWPGHEITLYPDRTQFGSDTVDCVRVRVKRQAQDASGEASAPDF